MNVKGAVEAALYSSSETLRISDIAAKTGFPVEEVRTAILDLRREYEERDSAIQIAKIGTEYRMMLRPEYTEVTGTFAKAELSGGALRTLTAIAYYQPVLQSKLCADPVCTMMCTPSWTWISSPRKGPGTPGN